MPLFIFVSVRNIYIRLAGKIDLGTTSLTTVPNVLTLTKQFFYLKSRKISNVDFV